MGGAFRYKKKEVKMTSHRWKTHKGDKLQLKFAQNSYKLKLMNRIWWEMWGKGKNMNKESLSNYSQAYAQANMDIYRREQEKAQEAKWRLREELESAKVEVQKRAAMEELITYEKKQREQNRSDIASLRQLQKTEIVVTTEGKVEIHKELFGEGKVDRPNFQIIEFTQYLLEEAGAYGIFEIVFMSTGGVRKMYLNLANVTSKEVNKKFNRAGIRFGFSHGKESEIREMLVVKLLAIAPVRRLPAKHGWFRDADLKLHFAFPTDLTWKELERLL